MLSTFLSSLFTTDEPLQKVEFSSVKLNEALSILDRRRGFRGCINIGRRDRDGRDVISQLVLSGDITSKKAFDQLEQLRRIGRLMDDEFTAAATSVANLGLELEKLKVFDSADRLLNGQATAGDRDLLVKPNKLPKTRTGSGDADKARKEAERLDNAIKQAAESAARLREQFDGAPRDIDRASHRRMRDNFSFSIGLGFTTFDRCSPKRSRLASITDAWWR